MLFMSCVAFMRSIFWDCYKYSVKNLLCGFTLGEFGIVYKAHYVKTMQAMPTFVAVKTLKGKQCISKFLKM